MLYFFIGLSLFLAGTTAIAIGVACFYSAQQSVFAIMVIEGRRRERRATREKDQVMNKLFLKSGLGSITGGEYKTPEKSTKTGPRIVSPSQSISAQKAHDAVHPKVPPALGRQFMEGV